MTRSSHRNYNRISSNQGDDTANNVTESNALDEPLAPSFDFGIDDGDDTPIKDGEKPLITQSSTTASLVIMPPIYHEINVVLMDAAQSKFNMGDLELMKMEK